MGLALSLPCTAAGMTLLDAAPARPSGPSAPTAPTRATGLAVWRPEVIRPEGVVRPPGPAVVIAEPGLRPAAMLARAAATRSLLEAVVEAGAALGSRPAGRPAATERERVQAVIATYRATATLDRTLRSTLQRARALLDERGLR